MSWAALPGNLLLTKMNQHGLLIAITSLVAAIALLLSALWPKPVADNWEYNRQPKSVDRTPEGHRHDF